MRKELANFEVKSIDDFPEGYFLDGQRYTGTIYWEFEGIIGSEFEVKDGLKDGLDRELLANGTVSSAINFKAGLEDGIGKYFYDSGKLKEEIFFEEGQLIWSNTYDEEGQLIERYESK